MAYFARLTAAGRAAVAAAIVSGEAVSIVDMAIGDGGGAPYEPTGDETDLVNERARVPVETVARDVDTPSLVRIAGIVPADEGGFWVREVGLFDAAGELVAIGGYPAAYKPTIAEGASYDLEISVELAVSTDADVTISETSGDFFATRDWVRSGLEFFVVSSAETSEPPETPADGETFLISAPGVGDWLGRGGQLARWRGALEGWQYILARPGMVVSDSATRRLFMRREGAWRDVTASTAEHLSASDPTLLATPVGVAAMIEESTAELRAQGDVYAVAAMLNAPPPEWDDRAQYLVGTAGAGAWAGRSKNVALWSGDSESWSFVTPRAGMLVIDAASQAILRFTAGSWRNVAASIAEHLAASDETLFATPVGVAEMLSELDTTPGDLSNFATFL